MAGSNSQKNFIVIAVGVALVGMIALQLFKQVPVGRVAVATLFGNAQQNGYEQGLHFPVNPLYRWTMFDARQHGPCSMRASKRIKRPQTFRVRISCRRRST